MMGAMESHARERGVTLPWGRARAARGPLTGWADESVCDRVGAALATVRMTVQPRTIAQMPWASETGPETDHAEHGGRWADWLVADIVDIETEEVTATWRSKHGLRWVGQMANASGMDLLSENAWLRRLEVTASSVSSRRVHEAVAAFMAAGPSHWVSPLSMSEAA